MICLRIPPPPTIANTNIDAKSNICNYISEIPNSDNAMQIDNANSTKRRHEDGDRNVQQRKKKNTQHPTDTNTENKSRKVKTAPFYIEPIKNCDNLLLTLKIHDF